MAVPVLHAHADQVHHGERDDRPRYRHQSGAEVRRIDVPSRSALRDQPRHERTERGCQERADYPSPEAIRHEHREVPDGDPHHCPDEQPHHEYRGG